jgi:methyltransferase-like protein/SAM-dependent methyltransferase
VTQPFTSTAPAHTSYDEIPYESFPFPRTHPNNLAAVATLLGLSPPAVETCRVLELGCAAGGNLIPIALGLPQSRCLGLDLSGRQVGHGSTAIDLIGLRNVELRHASITDVGPDWGEFDYLICHGVFSWVPGPVQDKILQICKENLAPNGVAYVSYNVYPGWHMKEMLRNMMCYHARRFADPPTRVRQARGLLDFLAQTAPEQDAYGVLLRNAVKELKDSSDSYLAHEFLEDVNEPVYFYEFVERAKGHGLQYLGEATIGVMAACNFPPAVQQKLYQLSSNDVEIEQFMDFVRNRTFRQTLLCHAGQPRDPALKPETVARLQVALRAAPETPDPDVTSAAAVTFKGKTHSIASADPLTKAALTHLSEVFPRAVPFEELRRAAHARLGTAPEALEQRRAADVDNLGRSFLQCYLTTDMVELHAHQPAFVLEASDRPEASPLARYQAPLGEKVTNMRHELVTLDTFGRFLLPLLNGARDHAAVVEALTELSLKGQLRMHENGQPVVGKEELRTRFERTLRQSLPNLGKLALLVR